MDLVWQIIGVVFALALLILAFKVYEKEKTGHATAIATLSLVALCFSFPWFQGFFRTHILGKISDLGKQMNAFQLTMGEMQDQLSKHQKELDTIQAKIRQAQSEVINSQSDITNQYHRLFAIQTEVATAQTNLDAQQKKIEDVEFLVSNLFAKTASETIQGDDTNRVYVLRDWGKVKHVAFLLKEAAIPNSIHGMFRAGPGQITMLPITLSIKNFFTGTFSDIDLKSTTFDFEYVKDSRETNLIQSVGTEANAILLRMLKEEDKKNGL